MRSSTLHILVIKGRLRPKFVFLLLFLFYVLTFPSHPLLGQAPPAAARRIIHGVVKSGNVPIPGVTVTATNSVTDQKVTTSTDVDGSYSLQVTSDGHYSVRAQMAAFAPVTKDVTVDATNSNAEVSLELLLLSRVQKTEPTEQTARRPSAGPGAARGFQNLAVMQSAEGQEAGGNNTSDIVPPGMPVP